MLDMPSWIPLSLYPRATVEWIIKLSSYFMVFLVIVSKIRGKAIGDRQEARGKRYNEVGDRQEARGKEDENREVTPTHRHCEERP